METQPLREHRRALAASIVGTAVEYYDFYLYGYAAALVFGPLFFPTKSPAAQTLFALMSFGIAFVARPFGAITFGHFGDRIGRKAMLVASMLLMGSCTLAIAFVPTYAMAGLARAGSFCVLPALARVLALAENGPEPRFSRSSMHLKAGIAGSARCPRLDQQSAISCATAVLLMMGSIMSEREFVTWGWRLPFLASGILIAIGLWVRLRVTETPEFREAVNKGAATARADLSSVRGESG